MLPHTLNFMQTDLPAQLGVDLAHCERQAQQAVEQSGGSMQIVQGEIITRGYFDGLAAEVDELLQVRDLGNMTHSCSSLYACKAGMLCRLRGSRE